MTDDEIRLVGGNLGVAIRRQADRRLRLGLVRSDHAAAGAHLHGLELRTAVERSHRIRRHRKPSRTNGGSHGGFTAIEIRHAVPIRIQALLDGIPVAAAGDAGMANLLAAGEPERSRLSLAALVARFPAIESHLDPAPRPRPAPEPRPRRPGRMMNSHQRTEGSNMSEQNPRQNVTFASGGGHAHGYLSTPASGSGPGVIVIQEWWGLDDHIAGIVDRLADEGFVALAPDLFGGRVAHDSDEAGQMMAALPVEQAAHDLGGAVDYLLASEAVTSDRVGAVGFCMGGGFVLQLAAQQGDRIAAAVPFYGVGQGIPDTYRGVTAAVQGHYGTDDQFYPIAQAQAQEEQIAQESAAAVEFHYYPAGHAFHNDQDRMGTYHEVSAKLAWERTVAFLRANLT